MNDIANKEAKLTAFQMFKGIVALPNECVLCMISEAYRMSSEITGKSWQRLWDNESTSRYTYDLIPVVKTKVTFSKVRDNGIAYCRMLLHDTMLRKDSHRTGTSDTPLCECGQADESVEHFLAKVNTRSRSLYAVARPSVVCLSVVCLSSVCRL